MKKVLLVVLAIVLFIVGGLTVAPVFVDWNAYRRDVAAALVQVTGREVTIAGDLQLSVLPLPHLTVRRISVASIRGAVERDLLRIGEMQLELAVAPLLKGQVAVRSLSLVDPVLSLETTADGRRNWELAPIQTGKPADRFASTISFETVSVSNGVLTWRSAGESPLQFDAIDATLITIGPTGAGKMSGTATFKGIPLRLATSLGQPGSENYAPFSATLDIDGTTGRVAATGLINWERRLAHGTVRATSPNVNALGIAFTGRPAPGLPAWRLSAESGFSVDAGVLELPTVALMLGEVRATGSASLAALDGPALTAQLAVGSMQLDPWIAAVAEQNRRYRVLGGGDPLAEIFSVPHRFTADLDLSVRTARWRGGIVRDIGATVRLGPEGLTIDRIAMRLPGGTDVTLSGGESVDHPTRWLQGDLAVISDNLRTTLAWAGVGDDTLPSDRMRSLSFTSRIAVTPDAVRLGNIAAKLDATRMTGAATIVRQARPSFGLRLALDRLEFDAYLPKSLRNEDGDAHSSGGIGAAGLFDANVVLSVGTMTLGGTAASQLSLDARLFDGDIQLRSLSIRDFSGATVALSGTVQDVAHTPTGDLNLTLNARDAERFATLLNTAPGPLAARIGRFKLDARLSGTTHSAAVSGKLAVAGGEIRAEGRLADLDRNPAFEFALSVSHPDSDNVLRLISPDRPYGGIGPMTMRFRLAGTPGKLAVRNLDALLGDMALAGTADISYRDERPAAVIQLTAGQLDTDRLMPAVPQPLGDSAPALHRGSARWSRQPMDLSLLSGLDLKLNLHSDMVMRGKTLLGGLDLHAELADGIMTVNRLTGSLFGGTIEGYCKIDATSSSPTFDAMIEGRGIAAQDMLLSIAGTDRLKGPLTFSLSFSAAGHSPFELVSSLSGNGRVSGSLRALRRGTEPVPAGPAGDAFAKFLNAIAPGEIEVSGALDIANGIMSTGNVLLDGGGAKARTVGTADLPGWRIDSTTTLRRNDSDQDPPELMIALGGSLDDPIVRLSGTSITEDPDAAPVPAAAPVTSVESVAPSTVSGQAVP